MSSLGKMVELKSKNKFFKINLVLLRSIPDKQPDEPQWKPCLFILASYDCQGNNGNF